MAHTTANEDDVRIIHLSGGCFWGVAEYFRRMPGVVSTVVGYANGTIENPTYEDVCTDTTGFAETVEVAYDPSRLRLSTIVAQLFKIIDPTSVNRQGNDVGTQYRTGVYWTDEADVAELMIAFARERERLGEAQLATELAPLESFYPAEDYHQDYLVKNPGGYCHVDFSSLSDIRAS